MWRKRKKIYVVSRIIFVLSASRIELSFILSPPNFGVINRPGVAGAVLQTSPLLTDSLSHRSWKNLQKIFTPKL